MNRTLPAPIGGLNRRDPLSAMPATDAVMLENLIPRNGYCEPRDRFDKVFDFKDSGVLDIPSIDEMGGMMPYSTNILITVEDDTGKSALYNIDTDAFIAAESGHAAFTNYTPSITLSVSVPTSDDTRGVNFQDNLIITGENAAPAVYNGSTVAGLTRTSGMSSTEALAMDAALEFKGRMLYYATNATPYYHKFWYAEAGSFQGVFNNFDFSSFIEQSAGNGIAKIVRWSADSGEGLDDYLVIVMTNGETLVYQGDDPGDANNFGLVGKYRLPPPRGLNDFVDYKGDVIYMTETGYTNLGYEFRGGRQFGEKMKGGYSTISSSNTMAYCPGSDLIIASGGVTPLGSEIAAFATDSGGWCSFYINEGSGTAAIQQVIENSFNNEIYISYASGEVRRTNLDAQTSGFEVLCHAQPAWMALGMPDRQKQLTGIRFLVSDDGQASIDQGLYHVSAGADFGAFDVSEGLIGSASNWGIVRNTYLNEYETSDPAWIGISAFGYYVTYSFYAAAVKSPIDGTALNHWRWVSTSLMFNPGGVI